jgi:hypothetical protein
MESRGNLIRIAPVILVVAVLSAGLLAMSTASAASPLPAAQASKKCKRKHHGKKRKCKRRTPPPAAISVSPAILDFGVPQIGGETRTVTVTNVGGSPSGAPVPTIMQIGADFSIAANGCLGPLAMGASCSVDIHVATTGAGHISGLLTVIAVPGGTATVPLMANIEA